MKNKLMIGISHIMNKRIVMILVVTAFLLLAECMPKAAAAIFEKKYVNRYQVIERDGAGKGIHYSLSVAEKMKVLCADNLRQSELFTIESAEELKSQAPDLIGHVKDGIDRWKEMRILPQENGWNVEENSFKSATYYTICNDQNSNLTVNVWLLNFVSEGDDIALLMDAEGYEIYALDMPNTGVNGYISAYYEDMYQGMEQMDEGENAMGIDISYLDDQFLEYWADSVGEQLRMYYSAYHVGCSYILSELNIVDFKIYFQTEDDEEEIEIPYCVEMNADKEGLIENGENLYVGVQLIDFEP